MLKLFLLLIIINLYSYNLCFSKEKKIELSGDIVIHLRESTIDSNIYLRKDCQISNLSGIYFINNKPIFGTDFEIPISKLDYAYLKICGKRIDLDVSCMYNPALDNLNINSFRIKKIKDIYIVNGMFSDGAGTYAIQWIINENSSIRSIISNYEIIISILFPLKE